MKYLLFIVLLFLTLICKAQRDSQYFKDRYSYILDERYSNTPLNYSTDSVYKFLEDIRWRDEFAKDKKIILFSDPISNLEVLRKGTIERYFGDLFELSTYSTASEKAEYPRNAIVDMFTSVIDTAIYSRTIDSWQISRMDRKIISVSDRDRIFKMLHFRSADPIDRTASDAEEYANQYKKGKQREIFWDGLNTARGIAKTNLIYIKMSVPVFDRSYNFAFLCIQVNEYKPIFLIYERKDGIWQYKYIYGNIGKVDSLDRAYGH